MSKQDLIAWVDYATEKLPQKERIKTRYHGYRIVSEGGLKGDVSDYWRNRYPELTDKMRDLFY